jgi:uncharacterized protein YbjT (DUF2867 family)
MQVNIERVVKPRICVLGGTGFVGQHLAALLADRGYLVRIPTRRSERHRALRVLPGVDLVQSDIHDTAELRRLLRGCEAAVNLAAILNERKKGDFEAMHVKLPRNLAHACKEAGVGRLLHMSALNAGAGASRYLKTKGEGEDLVHGVSGLAVTSFRPSVIFGPDDHFFNRFARLLKISPLMFPLACPNARFAPVFVGDVVHAMLTALERPLTIGQRYELCGPRAYTLQQLVEYTAETLDIRRAIIALGDGLSKLQARFMGMLPGKPFTYDNYLSMQTDAVCGGGFPEVFGIVPSSVESIVPIYLGHNDQRSRFDSYRHNARHSY